MNSIDIMRTQRASSFFSLNGGGNLCGCSFQNPIGREERNMVFTRSMKQKEIQEASHLKFPDSDDENEEANSTKLLTLFDKALVSDDWKKTHFYNYIFKNFIQDILTFGKDQRMTPSEFDDRISSMKKVSVKDFEKHVAICDLCNAYKTVSKKITSGQDTWVCGPRCAEKFLCAFNFYRSMDNLMIESKAHRKGLLTQILAFLES
jgi:hypothetical protein